ncbi:PrpF domain-containing protein [Eoetvoesiella caeni]
MAEQIKVACTIMRGGTSKAVFLNQAQVPTDAAERDRFLLAIFGSPDKRQIDGLGGADILTSKCAIIGPSTREDSDIDYTFAQIGIGEPTVSYEIVCGNISSAVGVYAIEEGLVRCAEPETTVRIHNTNTGKVLRVTVETANGSPRVTGDFAIDGVPGTGAEIKLDYSDTSGATTGHLLPTGSARNVVHVPSLSRDVDVSIVDVGTLSVFMRASDLGMTGTEMPSDFTAAQNNAIEEVRRAAAKLCDQPDSNTLTPFPIFVGPAASYQSFAGDRIIDAGDMDLVARMVVTSTGMHKAFPGGGSICISIAAQIAGTVVHECSSTAVSPRHVRVGHPSGVISIYGDVDKGSDGWEVKEVYFSRTARRLLDGHAYLVDGCWN